MLSSKLTRTIQVRLPFSFLLVGLMATCQDLPKSSIPAIQPTIPSPLQYGYRTKITPHFDPPPKKVQKQGPSTSEEGKPSWLKIGFNQTGKRVVMDIEV
jgi:tRNA (uracil-5-)-methyltransferase